jgi:cytochrome c-type biogenesis protein CcmH/NrfG
VALRDAQEIHALEMLLKITGEMAQKTDNPELRRNYFLEMAEWLKRLQELSRNPFHWYRLGRIYLWLGEKAEASRCFSQAARRLPPDSPYIAPAKKLAEDLAR